MNNEALLLDSEIEVAGETVTAEELNATNETSTDAAVDCSNGACVLNWKPARTAA
jgi:hypothetical protein